MATKIGPNTGLLAYAAAGDVHYTELIKLLRWLDFFMNPVVISYALTAPPGSPADGATYIVAASPTGAWAGQAQKYARWSTDITPAAWEFITPKTGWSAYNLATSTLLRFNGTVWV